MLKHSTGDFLVLQSYQWGIAVVEEEEEELVVVVDL